MRRSAPRAAAAAVVAATLTLSSVNGADLFDEIYARGKPLEASLKTLTANFTEESTSSLLTRPLLARGTLAVVRPSKVVLHYTEPEKRTVLIDAETMRLVWPSRGLDERLPIGAAQRRIQQYFVDKSPAQLRRHFTIAAANASDRSGAWLVTMTPTRKQIREGLTRLELWIERDSTMLSSLRMTFPSGDTKRMQFDAVRINPPIDPALFTPTPR